jgi:hypothetical protein
VCELAPKGRVVERVTHWEDARALGLEVIESDWPIRFMHWITRIEPSEGGARLTQDLTYEVKFGPLGWLLDRMVMERKLRATLDEVLARLVARAEASSAMLTPSTAPRTDGRVGGRESGKTCEHPPERARSRSPTSPRGSRAERGT